MAMFQFAEKGSEQQDPQTAAPRHAPGRQAAQTAAAAPSSKPAEPLDAAFGSDSQAPLVKQQLIASHIANGQFEQAQPVSLHDLTPDMRVALVLRRGKEALLFHPELTGLQAQAATKLLKRLNAMDGAHSGLPDALHIDAYKLPAAPHDAGGPGRSGSERPALWLEPRLEHRGIEPPKDLERALHGELEAVKPCATYEEALQHPYGIASFQDLLGGVYAYVNLGYERRAQLEKPCSAKTLEGFKQLLAKVIGDDILFIACEAVRDDAPILHSPLYLGENEALMEQAEELAETKAAGQTAPSNPSLFKQIMPDVFVRQDVYEEVRQALLAIKAKKK